MSKQTQQPKEVLQLITGILDRKRHGDDCTEYESAELKMFIKETKLPGSGEQQLIEDIQLLFPIEYSEALDEMERDTPVKEVLDAIALEISDLHVKQGRSAAIEKAHTYKEVTDEYCAQCETESPSLLHECLICGSPTKEVLHTQPDFICKNCGQEFNKGEETDNSCPNCGSPNYHPTKPLHTQGEWEVRKIEVPYNLSIYSSKGWHIATLNPYSPENINSEANAELIVKAVNELPNYKKWLKEEQDKSGEYCRVITEHENTIDTLRQSNKELREALDKLTEGANVFMASYGKDVYEKYSHLIENAKTALNNTK